MYYTCMYMLLRSILVLVVQDLLLDLTKRMDRLEKIMQKISEKMDATADGSPAAAVQEPQADVVNGINITRIPSWDAYSYGLQLMDILFTKEELAASLLFQSKKK